MNVGFIVYLDNGRIVRSGDCPPNDVWLQATQPGESVTHGKADPNADYLDLADPENPIVRPRTDPAIVATLSGNVLTLDNLPVPCTIVLNAVQYQITEASMEFEFPVPGKKILIVDAVRYLAQRIEVNL